MDLSGNDIETYVERLETAETKGIWIQHRVRLGPGYSKFESPDEGWEDPGSCSDFHWGGGGRFFWVVYKCQSIPKFKFEPCLLNPRVPSLSMRTMQRKPRTMASDTPLAIYERTSHYEVLFLFNVQDKAKSLISIDLFTESMFLKVLAVNLDMGLAVYPSLTNRRIHCAELHTTHWHDTTSKLRPSARYSPLPRGRKERHSFFVPNAEGRVHSTSKKRAMRFGRRFIHGGFYTIHAFVGVRCCIQVPPNDALESFKNVPRISALQNWDLWSSSLSFVFCFVPCLPLRMQ